MGCISLGNIVIDGAVFGGLMLILGNYQVFKGNVYRSIQMFLLADIAWLWLAISSGNPFGVISVSIGVILSFFAFYKMYQGKFYRTINKDTKDSND